MPKGLTYSETSDVFPLVSGTPARHDVGKLRVGGFINAQAAAIDGQQTRPD